MCQAPSLDSWEFQSLLHDGLALKFSRSEDISLLRLWGLGISAPFLADQMG